MIVFWLIKRNVLGKVKIEVAHMISNHIYHHIDIPFMTGLNKINEVLFSPVILV